MGIITGGIHLSSRGNHGCKECELGKFYLKMESLKQKYPTATIVYMGDMNYGPEEMRPYLQGRISGRDVFVADDVSQAQPPTCLWTDSTIDYVITERNGDFERVAGG